MKSAASKPASPASPASIESLRRRVRAQAKHCYEDQGMKLDVDVYKRFEQDPLSPILYGGNLLSPWGFFGRDPGKDEVRLQEPLIGAAGTLVRVGAYRRLYKKDPPDLQARLKLSERLFFGNTVPYKPLGNKSWGREIKTLFQPLIIELLVDHWQGHDLLTLGTEAFDWFGLNQSKEDQERFKSFWSSPQRYTGAVNALLKSPSSGREKTIFLHPLPHPSPLNVAWFKKFPALLESQLAGLPLPPTSP